MNNHILQPPPPHNMQIVTPRNQSEFYTTLRRYTERLKQQRDISLGYLNKINDLEKQLRNKDIQIDRLNKVNRQLSDKLSLYSSVLQRSQAKRPLRMSMILGKTNMTESIIQTTQQTNYNDSLKPFQQFFVADLSQIMKGNVKFRFTFNTFNTQQQVVSNLFTSNTSPQWEPQPIGPNNSERKSHFVMYMTNSPYTTSKGSNREKQLQFIERINPSFYYYIPCLISKQAMLINGKYFWIPVVYGFITYLPFPDSFFKLLQNLGVQLKIKNEIDQKKLVDSLNQLYKCPAQPQMEYRFFFINKLQTWKIPDLNNIDQYALIFSVGVIQKFALQLIIDVLILLLLEIPITVISQDQLLLCQFMFFFVYIIKPLKYPYPVVFNVNEKLSDLLQSPFPTFTGCTDPKIVDPFLNQRAVFDLDKKVAKSWPLLDHLDSSRQFLMKVAHHAGSYTKFNVVTQQIIKSHQYRQLQPYWKDFSKTQLYQNYVHKA